MKFKIIAKLEPRLVYYICIYKKTHFFPAAPSPVHAANPPAQPDHQPLTRQAAFTTFNWTSWTTSCRRAKLA